MFYKLKLPDLLLIIIFLIFKNLDLALILALILTAFISKLSYVLNLMPILYIFFGGVGIIPELKSSTS